MKICLRNLGMIEQAEMQLGDLTVLCGQNNSGKTYATYALYGFLSYWQQSLEIVHVSQSAVQSLLADGSVVIDIQQYIKSAAEIMSKCSKEYTKTLSDVFASSSNKFSNSHVEIFLDPSDIEPASTFERTMGAARNSLFSISKGSDSPNVTISLLVAKEEVTIPSSLISRIIGDTLKDIVFGSIFPRPFIASAERTGAAIFRNELHFDRNRLLKSLSSSSKDIDPFDLLQNTPSDYPLPIRDNVDFTRQIESVAKKRSFIASEHPEVIAEFQSIIGGDFTVTMNDELYFIPHGKRSRLTVDESSSSVRSLLDIGFYIRHVAQKGDLLIVDEPELNLHPSNQRCIARLFARLANLGIKVFITTHSDHIIRELNTLIMLSREDERIQELAVREHYSKSEFLHPSRVRVFVAQESLIKLEGMKRRTKCRTLVNAPVDLDRGIHASGFDDTIVEINRIQDEIIWGS
jgi:energy-coupling factor transporter ATP-binding protein EcfA2